MGGRFLVWIGVGQALVDIALRAGLVTLCLYEHLIWTQFQVQEL
ncbi:hypothetical protein MC7420_1530 [Coleofasciculus chthonoplastes PCC 7420]|uniref:Uncharacterized protein n=1 Tax=Coleofasciculus chthonoplastes PCC 7420 TaxID=118168 RepID=B4W4V9_9CYAN|nr:hypothetical protein MC7420_1530 [Coleofasciculus chthonoplastes PCC 7420]